MLLDTYAPLKRINKYKMKFKSKPWINFGLQKSISAKNKLLKNFINKKDLVLKEEFHTNSDYLSNENSSTIFLQPNNKEEIANIISSLNSNRASGPNSIPYRILFLPKNEISKQLADLFNLSFMTGVFPSVLKTAKVVPVFKKDSKLHPFFISISTISILRLKFLKNLSIL